MVFVVGRRELTADKVLAACTAELASYKVPQRIEFLASLPRDVLGKVDKKALRAQASATVPTGPEDRR